MISEAASKKKRGRPEVFTGELHGLTEYRLAEQMGRASRRQLQNRLYAMDAVHALCVREDDDGKRRVADEYRWLVDREANVFRVGILAELGRLGDPESIRAFAQGCCKNKPKAKNAISDIRRWRLGQDKSPGNPNQLTEELYRVIDSYCVRHRAMTDDDIYEVLMEIAHSFREQAEREAYEATA